MSAACRSGRAGSTKRTTTSSWARRCSPRARPRWSGQWAPSRPSSSARNERRLDGAHQGAEAPAWPAREAGMRGPERLPPQRKGVVPQGRGRYPDYDVLAEADHWDEVTRRMILDRVHNVPPLRFFDEGEARTIGAFCDELTAQHDEPKIPVLAYLDEKLHENKGAGYQYFDLPSDQEVWRTVARGLDSEARKLGRDSFDLLTAHEQNELVHK